MGLQGVKHLFKQPFLAGQGALLGAQGFVFKGLEFGGDKALGVFQGLAAAVVVGHFAGLALGDFDKKAVHFVELHTQIGNAGARAFTCFEVEQKSVAVCLNGAQLIQIGVKAAGDHAAVTHHCCGLGRNGAQQQGGALLGRQQVGAYALQKGSGGGHAGNRLLVGLKTGQRMGQRLAASQGLHQTDQLARAYLAQAQARGDAFHIGAALDLGAQGGGQGGAVAGVGAQGGQGLQALFGLAAVAPGLQQPVFELAAAHAGHAGVEQ